MRRGQGAIEFVLISVVMTLFFATAFTIAQQNYADIQDQRFEENIHEFLTQLEGEFLVAYQAGEGYEREIYIPQTLAGVPYEVELLLNESPQASDELVIEVRGTRHLNFLTPPVDGAINKGPHLIQGGDPVTITTIS